MKVRDLMTTEVRSCTPDANLGAAAALMLEGDCGMLPVVENGRLVGVVTDRDLFIAMGTRNQAASAIRVGQVMQSPVHTCSPDADVLDALAIMKAQRIRRLPVEGFGGSVAGVISMNDIVLASGRKGIRESDVVDTLRAICAHQPTAAQTTAA